MATVDNLSLKSASERLLFSTVKIESIENNSVSGSGTGFFYELHYNQKKYEFIVTNKHVVHGFQKGQIKIHVCKKDPNGLDLSEPSGKFISINIPDMPNSWYIHDNLDLAIMSMNRVVTPVNELGFQVLRGTTSSDCVLGDQKLKDLFASENILMVGYPVGLIDEKNNLPLMRRGSTASHPMIDYSGTPVGIIDIGCFPGSSGSPIYICDENPYTDKIKQQVLRNRLILLGLLYAGPQMSVNGEISVENIPTTTISAKTSTKIMVHLGYYIKAQQIDNFCKLIVDQAAKNEISTSTNNQHMVPTSEKNTK